MYPSDLSDEAWRILYPILRFKRCGPKVEEKILPRTVNGLLYALKTGCQWRMLYEGV